MQNIEFKDGRWVVEFTNQWHRNRNREGHNAVSAEEFFAALYTGKPPGRVQF